MLALYHPKVPSCEKCKTWVFDPDWNLVERGGKPARRPPGGVTPCNSCPKGSPENERYFKFSEKNLKTWRLYKEGRAIGWQGYDQADEVLRNNLAIVDMVVREYEQHMMSKSVIEGSVLSGVSAVQDYIENKF